ncbi:MAG: hemolysin family protein, partial [Mariprofundaceae bacterium]
IAMTIVVLILAEILPKTIAVAHAEAIAVRVAPPLAAIQWLLTPIVSALMGVIHLFKRLLRIPEQSEAMPTHGELASLIHLGRETGLLDPARGQMLHGSLMLHEIPVKALMTPRRDMVMLDARLNLREALKAAGGGPFSRYPVHGESADDIIGIVHLKDIITADPEARLGDLVRGREPAFIPATKSALAQLVDFQRQHQHMAIVVDEFGDIEGLITLEDIIEEIVGEIRDESDRKPKPVLWPQPDGSLVASGTAPIHDINVQLNLRLPEEGATTIGGLVVQTLGDQPEGGVCLELGGARIEVLRMAGEWIDRVRIRVQSERDAS